MNNNMGTTDRVVRLLAAAAVLALYLTGTISEAVAIVLGILAAVFVLTSIVRFCPLYLPLRLSTRKK
ncbi:MAG: hypothetical protein CMP06_10965 [Xanthomonadales bacterium]|nr:hypothetical protein [Xanthomonadales bacterium]